VGEGLATPISKEDRARLEKMGEARVRLQAEGSGFGYPFQISAMDWLAELADAEHARSAVSQAEMASTASRAATAAERAAKAAEEQAAAALAQARIAKQALTTARIATAIAALALIVSIVGFLHVFR
jgi:hypothetical protein